MQQFNDFRAGDICQFPTCSKGCSNSHCKRHPQHLWLVVLSPASVTLPRELCHCFCSQAPHTHRDQSGSRAEPRSGMVVGHGPGHSPPPFWGNWVSHCPAKGAGPVPGGCQGAQRAPCCLPLLLPPFSQHFVPTVNYKYISHGGRSSDKPCGSGCSRTVLPVCWPWHFSHPLCRKSQRST